MKRRKTNIVCLDSNIYVWGIKKGGNEFQENLEELKEKSENLINWLEESGKKIIMPAPVLTELTWTLDEDKRAQTIQLLSKRFINAPFDNISALICSEILNKYMASPNFNQVKEAITKRKLKYDAMIAAIAIKNNCDTLYTHDVDDFKNAKDRIEVLSIPSIPVQTKLDI